jgi:hypothetical protein
MASSEVTSSNQSRSSGLPVAMSCTNDVTLCRHYFPPHAKPSLPYGTLTVWTITINRSRGPHRDYYTAPYGESQDNVCIMSIASSCSSRFRPFTGEWPSRRYDALRTKACLDNTNLPLHVSLLRQRKHCSTQWAMCTYDDLWKSLLATMLGIL